MSVMALELVICLPILALVIGYIWLRHSAERSLWQAAFTVPEDDDPPTVEFPVLSYDGHVFTYPAISPWARPRSNA